MSVSMGYHASSNVSRRKGSKKPPTPFKLRLSSNVKPNLVESVSQSAAWPKTAIQARDDSQPVAASSASPAKAAAPNVTPQKESFVSVVQPSVTPEL